MPHSTSPQRTHSASEREHERRCAVTPGGVNSNVRLRGFPAPLTFDHGAGSRIWDIDGNEYIDYAMGMGPHILGHAPAPVTAAVAAALEKGQLFAGQNQAEGALAELLVDILPGVDEVRLGTSGSEMNLLAVRIARATTGRQRIVRFAGHYHGWLDPLFVDPAAPAGPDPALTPGQSVAAARDVLVLPWNDTGAIDAVFGSGHDIAAVVMEPVMCNTGVIDPRPGYLAHVRDLCDRHGTLLVIDEVITGFRLGLTGAQGMTGTWGDMTVYAKAIAAGFPVAALGARRGVMADVGTGVVNHSGTYNTGLIQTVAALATVHTLKETDPYPGISVVGAQLIEGLRAVAGRAGVDLVVEGYPEVFQTRFGEPGGVVDGSSFGRRSDAGRMTAFITALQSQGVRLTSRGLWFTSAAHSSEDVDRTLVAVRAALEAG